MRSLIRVTLMALLMIVLLPLPGQAWERDVLPIRVPGFDSDRLAELCLERRHKRGDRSLIGLRPALRRHLTLAKLARDLFEELTVDIRAAEVNLVEHDPRRLQAFVVAGHTILIQQRA